MMRWRILAVGLAGAVLAVPAFAFAQIDAARLHADSCAACHGPAGIAAMPETPSLAGQPDAFTQWQLVYFRSGTRKNEVMQGIGEALSNDEVRSLGAYYASLPPPKPIAGDERPELGETGARLAAQNRCGSCHGESYAGVQASARLAGQREDYLLKALRDFKAGRRSGGGVAAMAEAAYPLSDDDMAALAYYLARLP